MLLLQTVDAFRQARGEIGSLGLVPTMGYLHEGHLQLVRQARAENEAVAASIFVNPTQFGPNEDLARYPRDLQRDLGLLQEAGVELVFVPSVDEMYPKGYSTYVELEHITEVLEGTIRPGHFRGVATVVCKLFNITQPQRAYFGQKDAQQAVVIQRMVRDLNLPVEIVVVPTVREADGLALSSRNTYLNPDERAAASVLYRALQSAEEAWKHGERDAEHLRARMWDVLGSEPLARVDYVSVADPQTLRELEQVHDGALLSLAVRLGTTRLIDNLSLPADRSEAGP